MTDHVGETVHAHQGYVHDNRFVYQARCNCGWQGPQRWQKVDARGDLGGHIGRTEDGG